MDGTRSKIASSGKEAKKKNRHTALSTTRGDKKQRFLDLNEQGMPDDIAHG
jgi:hypothetical protein